MLVIPISGGPHTGKTRLNRELHEVFPEAVFLPEPATRVIERELVLQEQDETYVPNVPWIDYRRFAPVVLAESVELEAAIPEDADLVFTDRSRIDTKAYSRLNGFEEFVPEVERSIAAANYAFALFCEPVGTYKQSRHRRETQEEALVTHGYLREAYDETDIQVYHLPDISLARRIVMVREIVEQARE